MYDKKLIMSIAGSMAVSYKKNRPDAEMNEILNHIMRNIISKKDIKIFGIAAASYVVDYLNKNPNSTEKRVMQNLVNEADSIINSIEKQDNSIEIKN